MSAIGPIPGIGVLGAAIALPPRSLTTREALESVPIGAKMASDRLAYVSTHLNEALGLKRRHWSYHPGDPTPLGPTTAELATTAGRRALNDAALDPSAISTVIVATSTPHRYTGTVAAAVGAALGLKAACVDLRAGCSAGLFGLRHAALAIAMGAGPVLLIGADTFSAVIPPSHRLAVCLMADGAAALVLGAGSGVLQASYFESDGQYADLVATPGPMPPTAAALSADLYRLTGDLDRLDAQVPARYAQAIEAVLEHAQITAAQVDVFIPHQTTVPALQNVCALVGIDPKRLWTDGISRHGNIGAAGWIAGLAQARAEGILTPDQTVLSASVGGGMSWGAALWTW